MIANRHSKSILWPYHHDCDSLYQFYTTHRTAADAWKVGEQKEGVHVIYPDGEGPVDVWCDMIDGGWTVIQRRIEGMQNFNRNWSDYVKGFGDTSGVYWLGLKYQHLLTRVSSLNYRLRIELSPSNYIDAPRGWPLLDYYKFTVGNESSKYAFQHRGYFSKNSWWHMQVDGLFHGQRSMRFSTFDNDNDDSERNLAEVTHSGWWFGNMSVANPNSPYTDSDDTDSIAWTLFHVPRCADGLDDWNVNRTTMKIKRTSWSLAPVVPVYIAAMNE